jgi:hypothetical protein
MPLLALRGVKELGPALFMDMARFARAWLQIGELPDQELMLQLFFGFLLPQFEGIDDSQGQTLYRTISELVGSRLDTQLRGMLTSVLGLHPPGRPAAAADQHPTPEDDSDLLDLDLP